MNQKIIKIKSTQRSNILNIRWAPNNVCNFKCQYCFPDAHAGTYKSPNDLETLIKNFRHLFDYYKLNLNKDKFHLFLSGGEPTLWPKLGEFIKQIKEQHNVYITLVSNGSRTVRWWKEYGDYIDDAVLSFHVAQGDIDHHISVADSLHSLGKKVTVLVLMDPTIWDKSVESIEYMKKNSKHCWVIQAKEVVNFLSYTADQKRFLSIENKRNPGIFWFIKNYSLLINGTMRSTESVAELSNGSKFSATSDSYINKDLNRFLGWTCHIGIESLYINWTGDLQGSCGQSLFSRQDKFNILDDKFVEKFNPELLPVKCSILSCNCSPETHITKTNI